VIVDVQDDGVVMEKRAGVFSFPPPPGYCYVTGAAGINELCHWSKLSLELSIK
jgi:hypothetical protein